MTSREAGFSLLELLIASALGGLMLVLSLNSVIYTQRAYKQLQQQGHLQTNARFALHTLNHYLSQAGIFNETTQRNEMFFYLGACGQQPQCTFDRLDGSDQMAIVSNPEKDTDCTNQSLHIGKDDIIANVFRVQENGYGEKSLYCRGFNVTQGIWVQGGNSIALIDGIFDMQLQYLTATSAQSGSYRYTNASQVNDWNQVRAVTVSLIIEAESESHAKLLFKVPSLPRLDATAFKPPNSNQFQLFRTSVGFHNVR